MVTFDFSTYISPFTWRYGSEDMRRIFSEKHKIELWRKLWVTLAQAQYEAGLLNKKELDDLKKNQNNFDIERILEIEKETKHDLVAAIKEFAEKSKIGGGKIHLGATSMDITDNADVLRINEALAIVEKRTKTILTLFAQKIEKYARFPCIGYTHLQAAEPTTVGYRFAFYAQDLLNDLELLQFVKEKLKGKGIKGAVGTSASYVSLLDGTKTKASQLEKNVMNLLGIDAALITNQVYSRKSDFLILSLLKSMSSSLAKFAGDLRILQSAHFSEWSEPFGKKQVGSSAMPFKKNPVSSENICSLARYISHISEISLENATLSYLERTLDDSANRRIIIPESFLALDQILITAEKILLGLFINEKRITYNLAQYASFAATESILMAAVKKGASRQKIHEKLREISMQAWQEIQNGKPNPMETLLANDTSINTLINAKEIKELMNAKNHIGDAPQRALKLAKIIRNLK